MAFVRSSKFRHIFGKAERKENCYEDIRITNSSWESTYCAVNPKFLAIVIETGGGGAFVVVPLDKTGRLDKSYPVVGGHKMTVLDIAWNPFDDNMIASSSEDCTIKLWKIPDGGLEENLLESLCDLEYHQKKVGIIRWHPVAENILLSIGFDNIVAVWNLETGEVVAEVTMPSDSMFASACWNWTGSKIVTTGKDKKIRIFDGRTLEVLKETKGHLGGKPSYATYLKNGRIFTTGFSRTSERQYAVFSEDLENLMMQDLDNSNGVMFPFYDPDNNLIYLCGRGDTNIRYFEIVDEDPYVHYLSMFQSSESQKGIGMMPKRGLNVNQHEITRFYKLVTNGCQVVPMTVPRKSDLYQGDIYPDTSSNVPALTADQWIEGQDSEPNLMSMHQFFKETGKPVSGGLKKGGGLKGGLGKKPAQKAKPAEADASTPAKTKVVEKSTPVVEKPAAVVEKPTPVVEKPSLPSGDSKPKQNEQSVATGEPIISLPPGVTIQSILNDIAKLKSAVKKHENQIESIEEKMQQLEEVSDEGDSNEADG